MDETITIQDKIAAEYDGLSAKLQVAADYVVANPVDVATRSLRSISGSTGLAPATFSRLARALGFDNYEELRELSRHAVGRQFVSFSNKAERLQSEDDTKVGAPFLNRQAQACIGNIETLVRSVDAARLEQVVELLHRARNVTLFGAFGVTGIVEYMAYMGNYFAPNWFIAGRMGASLSSSMTHLSNRDVLVVITTAPFARRSILAVEMARERGAGVVVLTDNHACPALKHATVGLIHSTDSPQFFSSYVATLVLVETIIGMLVKRAGPAAQQRIQDVEAKNHRLGEFWTE
ncbi:MurR/RpiR family transcriptional regulator [Actibacterium ureilyticum]|uniref:MurR/RpiR family transcriptional regulator n=1 Tax=Actibacterium ureilyticum TaxID=1590614 RepID=UPI001FE252CA|nr:MurR/RpiR family transcriptional regulator [Actibacterium ureilyticum]